MAKVTAGDGYALFSPYARAVEKYTDDPSLPVTRRGDAVPLWHPVSTLTA
jgi:hypothetical protein